MSSRPTPRLTSGAARCLLAALALSVGLGGLLPPAQAAYLPIGLGPLRSPVPSRAPACPEPTDPLELAVWRVATADGRPDLSCGNAFVEYQRTPRSAAVPEDAFARVAEGIRSARAEVLLTNMEWQAGPGHPGDVFAQAVADLYARVRADPAAYPQGMSVRLALGGFPELSGPDGGRYALRAVRDLRMHGVPLSDRAVGWRVTVMNYPYEPHSHVKLSVIDGQDFTVAGYNFTDYHLPKSEPGGHGLHDLGLHMRGPAAQQAVAVFDDLWRHSKQIGCPEGVAAADVLTRCWIGPADPVVHPTSAQAAVVSGESRAFVLYRRPGEEQADRAVVNLLGAARSEIDLMEADFSPQVRCWLAYINPADCERTEFPVYLAALMDAMERGMRVRVLTVNYGYGAAANRAAIALMRDEARRRGLERLFDARYVTFDMHTKALTVDRKMVVAGSMNFHFSSWGTSGLNEAVLATSDPQAAAQQQASFESVWTDPTQSRAVPEEAWLKDIPREPSRPVATP